MYEIIAITENNYYIDCPTKVGIYESAPGEVWLIDGGSDKDSARKIWKNITERGWTIRGIIATHSNADHVGGCQLLQSRSGCAIYSSPMEAAVANSPVLESTILYGAYPPKPLRNKFLMAQPCSVSDIADAPLPEGVQIVALPGHFLDMLGVITPEGVFYCADTVFSSAVIEKYHVNFVYDVAAAIGTLEKLPQIGARYYLPAHAELTDDIAPLAKLNLDKMKEIIDLVLDICRQPVCFEDALQILFTRLGLTMDFGQYVLVGSSLRSYLAYLLDSGRLTAEFAGNKLLWSAAV